MTAKKHLLLGSMMFALSACGGSDEQQPQASTQAPTATVNPPAVASYVNLAGVLASNKKTRIQVLGENTASRGAVGSAIANSQATIGFTQTETVQGNVSFLLNARDPDGISEINLVLPSVNKSLPICSSDCGNEYERSVIGLSPSIYGASAGELRLEIWITDTLQNQVLADAITFSWQPHQIVGVTAQREDQGINLTWQANTELNRYNVYIATQPGVSPSNVDELENGQQFLSISDPFFAIPNTITNKSYQALITGIDGSGESGFSNLINIAPLGGELAFAPTANNDIFEIDEDTALQGNVLTNDTNPYSGQLLANTQVLVTPSHGSVTMTESGDFTYQPALNFNGEDAFSYQIINELGRTDTAVVAITINPINDAPTALNNTYNISNDGTLTVSAPGLLGNDSDVDLDELTVDVAPVNEPLRGQLTLFADGSFEYQGEPNMQGEDSFQYKVIDNQGGEATATVFIVSTNTNSAPVANNDSYNVNEDNTLVISAENGVLSNDTDPNGDTFTVDDTFIVAPTHGQLLLSIDGSFSYIPDANFNGVDQFQYAAIDSQGASATATVTVIVNSQPDNPVAQNDAYQFSRNNLFSVSAESGLLANDFNIETGELTVDTAPVTEPQNGTLNLNSDGSFTYQPNADFSGVDSFSYSISNEQGLTATAQVTLSESGNNTFPEASDDQFTIAEDSSATQLNVLANDSDADGDTITLFNVNSTLGSASIVNGQIEYTPPANFSGQTVLTYSITDGYENGSPGEKDSTASVTIIVTPVNDAPIANADLATINEDAIALLIDVLANDSDIDDDSLILSEVSADSGTALIVENKIQYTPAPNANGVATVAYSIKDAQDANATSTLSITILPINDAPVATADTATMDEDVAPITIDVLANDSDVDGDSLVISTASADEGTATIVNNQIQYTPAANANGVATVTYTASDNNGGTASSTLAITINPINDAPVATADTATMDEDAAPITIDVLANDSDVDGDSLVISNATADVGAVSVVNNQIQYTPAANANGVATVTYTASDNNGGTANSTLAITINPINDAPVATADTATMDEDAAPITIDVLANDSDVDGDSLAISTASADVGAVSVVNNQIQYTPAANANGVATVTYTASDNNGGTASSTVAITINPINDAPVATADTATMDEDAAPITIDVLANDSDVDGDSLAISTASADVGTATIVNNQIQYTPAANANGVATVTYTASDNNGGTSSTLAITINPINDAPIATADTATMDEDAAPITIDVLANDSDVDGDSLVISTASADVGTATIVNNQIQYTPAANANGVATVAYTASDNNGGTANSTLAITINPINDPPIVAEQSFSINEDATDSDIIGTIVATDNENQDLTYVLAGGDFALFSLNASSGILSVNGETPFDYETKTQYILNIQVTDNGTPNETTAVNITVNIIDVAEPLIPVEDTSFGRPISGQLDLGSVFSSGQFNDSIVLNNNLYFVGFTNNADKDILIVSYTNNGGANTAFNTTGTKILDLEQDEEATAIISDGTDLFIAYSSFDGSNNEACVLKMDLAGALRTGSDDDDDGESNTGIKCTTLNSTSVINDLEVNGSELVAVGKHFDGTQTDSLWIHYKTDDLSFENSTPAIVDVSGANRDDEGYAVKNFENSDYLVVGSVTDADGTKNSLLRYLKANGDNDGNFNGGVPLIINLSSDLGQPDSNKDDELFAIGGLANSNFTAFAGGYMTRQTGEKEAVMLAIDKNGELVTSFDTDGIAIYDIDGESGGTGNGVINGGAQVTGIQYEPIKNEIMLSGTTGIPVAEHVFTARVISSTGLLDDTYGESGVSILSGIDAKQIVNTTSIDSNDTLWVAGIDDDTNAKPFIGAITDQAALFTNFNSTGYLTVDEISEASNDKSMKLIQLSNGAQAGKYMLASTAETNGVIKLVLTRFTSTGAIDTSFSKTGHKEIAIELNSQHVALAELNNGNLLLAGAKKTTNGSQGFVAKVDQDGSLDTTFATDGIYVTNIENTEALTLSAIAITNSNNIVAVGTATQSGNTQSFAMMLTVQGALATSFGTEGVLLGLTDEDFSKIHINSNEIFIAGELVTGADSALIALKLNLTGNELFRYSGTDTPNINNKVASVLTDSSGAIYLVANLVSTPDKANVVRLLSSGALDTSFADNGVGQYSLAATGNTLIKGAKLDSTDKLILVGTSNNQGVIARITTNGELDNTFGTSGVGYYQANLCTNSLVFSSLILQTDTQIALSSTCDNGNSNNISVSKFDFYPDGVEP
ncbi:Ig-like domain-containing protein [Pseudoalteromonas marina]|uniref:Ig-like domain-containing protein n=1 Tax=Pseudoalteromonas marina TaxID=267375 RepID=UPI0023F0DB31|nr:Ig-like domain-containing protein [Pseudoalteromonas marina]